MDKSQMHFAKWKKQDSEGYLLCGCIHMSFYRQQSYMAMGNRSMVGEGFHCRVSTRACVWGGRTILWLLWWQFFYFLSQFYLFIYFTLQYCIDFAIHWHESAMGVHVFPILNPLPPPSPSQPSGSSQCTSPEHPVSCIKPGLAIRFTCDNLHVSMPFSHIIPPSPQKTNTVWFHLHEALRVVIIIETQSSMAVARGLEERRMESYFTRCSELWG